MGKAWKRTNDGKIMVNGKKYEVLVGSRRQVWNGTAYKTGHGKKGLTRAHLVMSRGRIVSKKARASALKNGNLGVFKKLAMKNKGKKFVTMKRSMVKGKSKKSKRKTRRRSRK